MKKAENPEIPEKSLNDKFFAEFKELQEKYKVTLDIKLLFQNYRVLPTDLQLALEVISKHNPSFALSCKENDNKV